MMDNDASFSIAIVGGGAASVAFLHHFISVLPAERGRPVKITIIEERPNIGPGLAYQEDIGEVLLNRPAKTMSASGTDLATFRAWLEWKRVHYSDVAGMLGSDLNQCYLPRPLFGKYLCEFYRETVAVAKNKNVFIDSLNTRVVRINKGERTHLQNQDGSQCYADVVLLCVGNTAPVDNYGLSNFSNYINTPYPVGKTVARVKPNQRVAILGSSLSAVDVTLALTAAGHAAPIMMISREGRLPTVRSVNNHPHTLVHFTKENVERYVKRNGKLRLRDLSRLLRKEMKSAGEDWRVALRPAGDASAAALSRCIADAGLPRRWQAVLASTNTIIEYCWHHLTEHDKELWMRLYHRIWMSNRAPIPSVNAIKLQWLMQIGRLQVLNGIQSIRANQDGTFTVLRTGQLSEITCDVVINATGASRNINTESNSPLLWKLIHDGYATQHRHGGIDVEFETSSVIDANGMPDRTLRAVGHVTSGVYYFTSSLEMISKKTLEISRDILKLMSAHKTPKVRNIEMATASSDFRHTRSTSSNDYGIRSTAIRRKSS